MKKKVIIICGSILSVVLISIGYYIKNEVPKEYYLKYDNDYVETITNIHQIKDKTLINIYKTLDTQKYKAVIYEYDNGIHLQLFKKKINDYYTLIYSQDLSIDDRNIYYKVISDNDYHVVIVFGYNSYNEPINFVMLNNSYSSTTDDFSSNTYGLSLLETIGDIPEKIRIYNQDHSDVLGETKRCD